MNKGSIIPQLQDILKIARVHDHATSDKTGLIW